MQLISSTATPGIATPDTRGQCPSAHSLASYSLPTRNKNAPPAHQHAVLRSSSGTRRASTPYSVTRRVRHQLSTRFSVASS
jgi:hypothetical protein